MTIAGAALLTFAVYEFEAPLKLAELREEPVRSIFFLKFFARGSTAMFLLYFATLIFFLIFWTRYEFVARPAGFEFHIKGIGYAILWAILFAGALRLSRGVFLVVFAVGFGGIFAAAGGGGGIFALIGLAAAFVGLPLAFWLVCIICAFFARSIVRSAAAGEFSPSNDTKNLTRKGVFSSGIVMLSILVTALALFWTTLRFGGFADVIYEGLYNLLIVLSLCIVSLFLISRSYRHDNYMVQMSARSEAEIPSTN